MSGAARSRAAHGRRPVGLRRRRTWSTRSIDREGVVRRQASDSLIHPAKRVAFRGFVATQPRPETGGRDCSSLSGCPCPGSSHRPCAGAISATRNPRLRAASATEVSTFKILKTSATRRSIITLLPAVVGLSLLSALRQPTACFSQCRQEGLQIELPRFTRSAGIYLYPQFP